MLTVDLKSAKLDFDDLGVVFGLPIGTGKGETENAEQVQRQAGLRPLRPPHPGRSYRLLASRRRQRRHQVRRHQGCRCSHRHQCIVLDGTLRDSVLDFERAFVKSGSGDPRCEDQDQRAEGPCHHGAQPARCRASRSRSSLPHRPHSRLSQRQIRARPCAARASRSGGFGHLRSRRVVEQQ